MENANNIGYLLQHLSFILARHSEQVLQEQLGIGFAQYKILMVLEWNPEVRQRWIANRLSQTEAGVSRQIKILTKLGLISHGVNPHNRRNHSVRLTPKGIRLTDKATEILNRYHQPMFDKIRSKHLQEFNQTLNLMHDYACTMDDGHHLN